MRPEQEKKFIKNNRFMEVCGIRLKKRPDGSYITQLETEPRHHNPHGMIHGGVLYTMADIAAGANARRHASSPVTLDSDFHFLTNVPYGTLTASAETVRVGGSVIVLRVTVTSDEGVRMAEGTFTFYELDR